MKIISLQVPGKSSFKIAPAGKLPHPANVIVRDFAKKLLAIEPGFIDGIYLTGSIPMNDFHPGKSDIDFLVFCKSLPGEKMAAQLKAIHTEIEKQSPKPNLSGCYIESASIQADDPEKIRTINYENKSMRFGTFNTAYISLYELKTNAVTVFGTPADKLPVRVTHPQLNQFLFKNINAYWAGWVKHASLSRQLFLFMVPRFTEWIVLGTVRQLCTLQTGKIVSKTDAGYYGLANLPAKFHPIIKEAIRIRDDNRTYPLIRSYAIRPSFKRFRQTAACAKYIIGLFNKIYNETL